MYEDADFSGWATKTGIECSDGRTIGSVAFAHQDNTKVPLVWGHKHDGPTHVLGHAYLEQRDEGVYCYGYFNKNAKSIETKELLQHGDIDSLSIWANNLKETIKGRLKEVVHGVIREVSVVLSGANEGARIENVALAHSYDDDSELETAIIWSGPDIVDMQLKHSQDRPVEEPVVEHAADDEIDPVKVYETLNDDQKLAVNFLTGAAIEQALEDAGVAHSDTDGEAVGESTNGDQTTDDTQDAETSETPEDAPSEDNQPEDDESTGQQTEDNPEGNLSHQEGSDNMSNVFDRTQQAATKERKRLTHEQFATIMQEARDEKKNISEAFLAHADEYGFGQDIDLLFPDARSVTSQPELIARRTEWVAGVIDGATHRPFARIKSTAADLTADEARARGYVKGNKKKDEVVKLLKRVTTPTTIYKKQKLDRDDIVDITDLDVVAWLKWEMRFMLEEELARAILISDGREVDDDDKINEDHVRPIAYDDDMYAHKVTLGSNSTPEMMIEAIIRARKNFKGTGRPAFYTTDDIITDLLLIKDKMGRFVYDDEEHLARKMRVTRLIPVEVMETVPDILGIMVNISDYTIGADKGGQLSMFDDFDIDFNQFKYLIETRVSGALTKPKSAVVIRRTTGTQVVATQPTFVAATNKLTIPTVAGVDYYDVTSMEDETALTDGETYHLNGTVDIEARATSGYSFAHNTDNDWTFAENPDGDQTNAAGDPVLPTP